MALTRTVTLKMFAETAAAQAKLDAIKAEADKLAAKNPAIKPQIEKAAALRQMAVLRAELKAEGDKAGQDLGAAVSDGTKRSLKSRGGGGSWIAAAIGLGAPLAGPLAAAGLGFSAFGALAAGSLAPVAKAMTGPGGLAAGWVTLDARQKTAAAGVQALASRYEGLSKSMEPRTFQIFNTALSAANGLLGPLGRLAATSGAGVERFFVQFENDAGLQKFVNYAGTVAPQAIGLLGTDVTTLVHSVLTLAQAAGGTGLLELRLLTRGLQVLDTVISHLPGPLAGAALGIGGILLGLSKLGALSGLLRITGLAAMGSEAVAAAKGIKDATIATRGLAGAQAALDAVSPFVWVGAAVIGLGALTAWLSRMKNGTDGTIATIEKQNNAVGFNTQGYFAAAKALGTYAQSSKGVTENLVNLHTGMVTGTTDAGQLSGATRQLTGEQQKLISGGREQIVFLATLESKYGLTRQQAVALAQASGVLVDKTGHIKGGLKNATSATEAYANSNLKAKQPVAGLAAAVAQLTTAMQKNVTTVLTLQGDEIGWRQAQQAATAQLKSNTAGLDGNTKNALANKQAVLSSSSAVVTFATDQLKLHGNLRAASADIQDQIGWLRKHGEGSKFARDEIRALLAEEAKIKAQIGTEIKVSGQGSWQVVGGQGSRGRAAGAAGMFVRGGTPGRDSVDATLMPGEVVVPTRLVQAGAVDHLRGRIPGFAAGGVVGSYRGTVPGLGGWLMSEDSATIRAVEAATAAATLAGIRSATAAASSGGGGHAGPGGGSASANEALARRLFPWGPAQWAPFVAVAMRESGFSSVALNASSGAYGIAQALPASKYPLAGRPPSMGGSSNPTAQLTWMFSYIAGRYGTPANAEQHELTAGWYDRGGWLPQGLSLAYNGTGRPEPVGAAALSAPAVSGGHGTGGGAALTARQVIGLALAAYYQHPQSATADRAEERKYLRDIAKYYSGSSAKWRDKAVERQTGHLISVGDKISALSSKIASARSYQQSVQQGLAGFADLSQMTLGGSMQGSRTLSGAGSLSQQLHGQLGNLRKFAGVLRKLSAAKVAPELIRQVVALGPGDGTAFGEEILAGGPALIKSLNATESAIGKTETQISRGAASAVYEGRYEPGKDFLKQLQHDKAGLRELFRDLGQELGREASRWFRVPRRRRPKGMAAGGMITEPIYGWGASGQEYMLGERGPERVTPLTGGGHGALVQIGTVNVREAADIGIISQRVGFAISAAGLG